MCAHVYFMRLSVRARARIHVYVRAWHSEREGERRGSVVYSRTGGALSCLPFVRSPCTWTLRRTDRWTNSHSIMAGLGGT